MIFAVGLLACSSPTAEYYYKQGRQLREQNQPIEAMESFIAATRVDSREYVFKARSFSNMATMCRMGERHELAFVLYERSFGQFVNAGDTLAQAYALNNMAWEKAVLSDKKAATILVDSALQCCSDSAVQDKMLESRAAACLYAAEYDSVLFYTQKSPNTSVYFDILCAQAFTFLGQNDSALFYAKRVCDQTDNPRYLDAADYILAHCDSTAEVGYIRSLAEQRADILMNLERNNPEWIEAMLLAERSLQPKISFFKRTNIVRLLCAFLILVFGITTAIIWRRMKQARTLERQCRAIRKSTNVREELQLDNYPKFCATCNSRLFGIADKLEQKGLTEREIRICVLVLIGFSYAEIAEVLFRAESGIGKDKYLIAKRLGVSVKDLQATLQTIAKEKKRA